MPYRTRRFNTAYTRALPILGSINPIARAETISLKSTLVLSSHLRLGLPKFSFLYVCLFLKHSYFFPFWLNALPTLIF